MMTIVPDASVLLKWVLPSDNERYVNQALAMRDALLDGELKLLVPDLWYYEVGNTLSRNYPDHADILLGSLMKMELECAAPEQVWQADIVYLVAHFNVTFYDAAYHALAMHRDAVFVTADERYIREAGSAGHILHLKEWKSLLQ
jgi:predicted nucleic acid-binding protein